MKIILLTSGPFSIPCMHYLAGQKMLHSVVSPGAPNKNTVPIELNAGHLNIPFKRFLKHELFSELKNWLTEAQPDLVLVFGCGYKISAELFAIPKFGFHNVHFSLLPAYRGKSPVFWQIKNGETEGGITIHQMTESFDSGAMLMQHQSAISPGDTLGLYTARLAMESVQVISKAIEKLLNTGNDMLYPQNEDSASYFPGVGIEDLKINWETQSAKEIENLVNATNAEYGGAISAFRGQPLRIIEVMQIQVTNPADFAPGSIIHADANYGILVACKNTEFLRINIVQTAEGIFSGIKLAGLGIRPGDRFESAADLSGVQITV